MCGLSLLIPLFIKPLYFSHYTSTYSGQQQQALWPSVIFYCIQQAKQEHVNIKLEECFFQPSSICIRKKVKGPECNKYKMAFCWTKRQIMWFAWEVEHYSTRRPERSLITNIRKRLTARFMLHLKKKKIKKKNGTLCSFLDLKQLSDWHGCIWEGWQVVCHTPTMFYKDQPNDTKRAGWTDLEKDRPFFIIYCHPTESCGTEDSRPGLRESNSCSYVFF